MGHRVHMGFIAASWMSLAACGGAAAGGIGGAADGGAGGGNGGSGSDSGSVTVADATSSFDSGGGTGGPSKDASSGGGPDSGTPSVDGGGGPPVDAGSGGASDSGTAVNVDGGIDLTHLPVYDGHYSTTTPAAGVVYRCTAPNSGGGGAMSKGPWFNSDGVTWNSLTKLVVQGSVTWASTFAATVSGTTLTAAGNGLPSHTTGTFPVAVSDPVHKYDGNPNSISASTLSWALTTDPVVAATPSCLPNGAIGVLLTGSRVYNANDELGRDAVAWEGQDACQGHPQMQGQYHYHSVSTCAVTDTAGQHSPLVGYAADGFGIFGNLGEGGVELTNDALDECHGHTHAVSIRGTTVTQYHYHATHEYPYTLGCYRGTPVAIH